MSLSFDGLRVVVMGLGRFGGGVGVTRWLVSQGADVIVTDLSEPDKLSESIKAVSDIRVTLHLGGHDTGDLDGCDLLVVNPAIDKKKSEFFRAAREANVPWTSEMNLFFERCSARIIGVTGSAGKSTTVAMLDAIMSAAVGEPGVRYRNAWLGGNIGVSLLEKLDEIVADDWVILELSSFQLEDLACISRSPHVAAITGLFANHLDRHGTIEEYARVKANILRFQSPADYAVLNAAQDETGVYFEPALAAERVVYFDPEPEDEIRRALVVGGRHNAANASAAAAIARIVGLSDELIVGGLCRFKGLPHRLEFVRSFHGVDYYNDSKSTIPRATVTALEAFDRPVILMVGGYDKGLPLDELAGVIAARAKAVICFGQVRHEVHAAVHDRLPAGSQPRLEVVADFGAAIRQARWLAESGDVVLLSPGFASYDNFVNYEERGAAFRQIVNE